MAIRPIEARDEARWRELWAAYCAFYEADVPAATTDALWTRLMREDDVVRGLVAADDEGRVVAFTHYVLHPHTWSDRTLCYLEDLFVTPEARGRRIAQALIERLVETARARGWKRVYWHTPADNAPARRVYDRFAPADAVVRYTLEP